MKKLCRAPPAAAAATVRVTVAAAAGGHRGHEIFMLDPVPATLREKERKRERESFI